MTPTSGELSQGTQAIVWLPGACPCHPDDQDAAHPIPTEHPSDGSGFSYPGVIADLPTSCPGPQDALAPCCHIHLSSTQLRLWPVLP